MVQEYNVGAIHESPENNLTQFGIIVNEAINNLPDRFNIKIDKYVIMPNHIHILISIPNNDTKRAIRESPLRYKQTSVSQMIGWLKMNVSKKIHITNPDLKVWQRSFHDHIIRNETDYEKIWQYIDTNVERWELDCFYTK